MIVYCCPDLIFATKIRAAAESLGIVSRPARDAGALQRRLDQVDDGRPNDPVRGVLVDLDLQEPGLALIEQARHHDPDIHVVAFGAHVLAGLLQAARERGADFVMPRGTFTASLPDVLHRIGAMQA